MALTIEIQVSTGGIGEGSFSPLTTIADPGTGFTYDHTPVNPGQLYIYRARRRDDSQDPECQYSDWSPLVFTRGAYPEENSMPSCSEDTFTGNLSALGLAVEACNGIPTKADWMAEYLNGTIAQDDRRVYGRSLRNATTMRRKVVKGIVQWEGQIEIEITPEGPFPRLQGGIFPVETTGGGPTYTHRFANKVGGWTLTLTQLIGETYFVFPGCRVASVEYAFSKEQDSVLTATFTLIALDRLVFPLDTVPTAATLLGMDTAATDPLDPYSAAIGEAQINEADADVRTMNFSVASNARRKHVFNGKRGARTTFVGMKEVNGSATLFYSHNDNLERDMGVSNPAGSFAVGSTITLAPVSIEFPHPDGLLGFYMPNCDIRAGLNVPDENEIPEELTFMPIDAIGDASETDFYIEITNTEPNADLIAPGTAILALPTSDARKYEHGTVTGVPTTTSIAAGTSTHLSSADDFYNGRTLRFITGTQAGNSRTITDYTGATRTFTTAAFGGAPAAGDLFEVI